MKNPTMPLKKITLGLMLAGGVVGSAWAAVQNFDINKINANVAQALDELAISDKSFNSLSMQLIPEKTDVENDNYGFDATLDLSSTPWSEKSSKIREVGTLQIQSIKDKDGHKDGDLIELAETVKVETDTLAFVRHYSSELAQKCAKGFLARKDKVKGLKKIVAEQVCASSIELARVDTLAALSQALNNHKAAVLGRVGQFVSDAAREKDQISSPAVKEELGASIYKAKIIQKAYSDMSFVLENDTLTVQCGGASMFMDMVKIAPSTTKITTGSVEAYVKADVILGMEIYKHAKPQVIHVLKGLEDGDAFALKALQNGMQFSIEVFLDLID